MIRCTVYYAGRVQGVGFRLTTQRIASRYDVTGYVRNLPDGRVELIAEGAADEVDAMVADVGRTMRDYINETKTNRSEAAGRFDDFSVRY